MNALIISNQTISQHNGLFSLNDLHKVSGGATKHQPTNFLRNEETKELIAEIESENQIAYHTVQGGNTKVVKQGTYVCRELVYRYAMWISAKFSLMVIRAFDAMNTGAVPCLDHPVISTHQAQILQKSVKTKCGYERRHYQKLYNALYDEFGVTSYKDILADDFGHAMDFVRGFSFGEYEQLSQNAQYLAWHAEQIHDWYKSIQNAFHVMSPHFAAQVHDHIIHANGYANRIRQELELMKVR